VNIITALKYAYRAFIKNDDYSRFYIAHRLSLLIYPKSISSEYGRIIFDEQEFRDYYFSFENSDSRSFDRKYFLKEAIKITLDIPGDTAECGVFKGASSWLICQAIKETGKNHHLFDSFSGLPEPGLADGAYWSSGDLSTGSQEARKNLVDFRFAHFYEGWIPEKFSEIEHLTFSFVHIDVDLFEPTLASLRFFYPRLSPGGVIICDDYGFNSCPGAKKAMDDFFSDKVEKIILVPTGQAMVIKK